MSFGTHSNCLSDSPCQISVVEACGASSSRLPAPLTLARERGIYAGRESRLDGACLSHPVNFDLEECVLASQIKFSFKTPIHDTSEFLLENGGRLNAKTRCSSPVRGNPGNTLARSAVGFTPAGWRRGAVSPQGASEMSLAGCVTTSARLRW